MCVRRSFFTLVEMLIVVAIIAILAALLAPTLRRSLAAARDLECTNNMHMLVVAQVAYCNDYNDRFKKEINSSGVNWANEAMWQDVLLPYSYEQWTKRWDYDYQKNGNYWQRPRVWQMQVDFGNGECVYAPKEIFACPSITKDQRRTRRGVPKSWGPLGLRWDIGMNRVLIMGKPPPRVNDVKSPGATIMFSDMMCPYKYPCSDHEFAGRAIGNTENAESFWYEPSYGNPPLPYRHGQGGRNGKADGGFNVACVGGNVRYVPRALMPESDVAASTANKKAEVKFYKGAFVR